MTDTKTPTWAKRAPLSKALVKAQLEDMASAAYSCARTTTEEATRAGYMDRCHTLREAARLLK